MATTATQFRLFTGGLILSVAALFTSCAQGQYGQPSYPQNPNRPDYSQQQPDYDYQQPGYDNRYQQPGYDNGYGRPDFYGNLAPHGQWVNTPEYGRVWIPNVGPDFQPYASNGHWVWTEYGNTWVSDYDWGWAPFHYGRWYRDRYRGWAWVPGYDWGPAWVSWRSGGGYYGWAPLGPGLNVGVNVNIPAPYWVFVPQAYVTHPRLYSYCVPRPQVVNIYNNTTVINNTYRVNNRNYGYGPRREDLERATRQQVPVYRVENTRRPGRDQVRDNTIGIYRPNAGPTSEGRTYGPSTGSSRGGRVYNEPYGNTNGGRDNARGRQVPAEALPAEPTPTYPQTGYGSSRGNRGSRPGYEGQPQAQPQPSQPTPQPAQTYPQPAQPQPSQREWGGGGRRSGGYSSGEVSTPASPQAQPQRSPAEGAGQPAPGSYNSGRGSSRGRGGN